MKLERVPAKADTIISSITSMNLKISFFLCLTKEKLRLYVKRENGFLILVLISRSRTPYKKMSLIPANSQFSRLIVNILNV